MDNQYPCLQATSATTACTATCARLDETALTTHFVQVVPPQRLCGGFPLQGLYMRFGITLGSPDHAFLAMLRTSSYAESRAKASTGAAPSTGAIDPLLVHDP